LKLKARALTVNWAALANIPLHMSVKCRDGDFLILGKIVGDKALIIEYLLSPLLRYKQESLREG
jgi:hydrogenase-4 membrane subunit HyfE